MNNITIGIPKCLLYYKYKYLWLTFFKELGINVLVSKDTDIDIFNYYEENDDICIPLKIFFGHVSYLIDKVDYILIPRVNNNCNYFNYLYDITNNIFNAKLIEFNIDKNIDEEDAFINLGSKLGFSKTNSLITYKMAKKEEYKHNKINYLLQKKRLKRKGKKILLISNEYLIYDEYLSKKIIKKIKDNNIDILYSFNLNPDNNKEIITSIEKKVNYILFILPNNCFYNSVKYYKIKEKLTNKKILFINLEEDNIDDIINKVIYE